MFIMLFCRGLIFNVENLYPVVLNIYTGNISTDFFPSALPFPTKLVGGS